MLAIVAGAVRSYLVEAGGVSEEELGELEFRIMAPVSVRTQDDTGALGNKVAMWLMELPLGEPDPGKRMQIVTRATRSLKETDQALGAALSSRSTWPDQRCLRRIRSFLSGRVTVQASQCSQ